MFFATYFEIWEKNFPWMGRFVFLFFQTILAVCTYSLILEMELGQKFSNHWMLLRIFAFPTFFLCELVENFPQHNGRDNRFLKTLVQVRLSVFLEFFLIHWKHFWNQSLHFNKNHSFRMKKVPWTRLFEKKTSKNEVQSFFCQNQANFVLQKC